MYLMNSLQVEIARKAIIAYAQEKKTLSLPEKLPEDMQKKAGVFVSLKKHHQLRGCIGTFQPTHKNIAEEIIVMAIEAANFDPRFPPVKLEEMEEIEISVDVLTAPEPINSSKDLDPKKYGLIVQSGYKKGLLLPDIKGVDTVEQQIEICRKKAAISAYEKVRLFRFSVVRYQ